MKFFEDLSTALTKLESRGSDRVLMDMSVQTKKAVYDKLLAQAKRISNLLGDK
jgi:hypothetical protein